MCVQTLLITFAILLRNKTKLFYFLNHTRLHEDDHKIIVILSCRLIHAYIAHPSPHPITLNFHYYPFGIDRVDEGSCSGSSSADNKLRAFRMPVTLPRYNLIIHFVYLVMAVNCDYKT